MKSWSFLKNCTIIAHITIWQSIFHSTFQYLFGDTFPISALEQSKNKNWICQQKLLPLKEIASLYCYRTGRIWNDVRNTVSSFSYIDRSPGKNKDGKSENFPFLRLLFLFLGRFGIGNRGMSFAFSVVFPTGVGRRSTTKFSGSQCVYVCWM